MPFADEVAVAKTTHLINSKERTASSLRKKLSKMNGVDYQALPESNWQAQCKNSNHAANSDSLNHSIFRHLLTCMAKELKLCESHGAASIGCVSIVKAVNEAFRKCKYLGRTGVK